MPTAAGYPLASARLGQAAIGISASNLWYAVALHDNVRLLGDDDAHKIPTSQHRLLTHVSDEKKRTQLARETIKKQLTVKQLESLIREKNVRAPDAKVLGRPALAPAVKQFNEIERAIDGLKVFSPDSVKGLAGGDRADVLARARMAIDQLKGWVDQFEVELGRTKSAAVEQ